MSEQTGFQSGSQHQPKPARSLRAILSLMGFTAVIAQVVLMRELLVVFYGNELSLGVMLANWLLWTALGSSVLGRWATRASHPRRFMAGLQTLTAFALPLTLLAVRASKVFFQSIPGEILGPVPMFLTSFLALSVFCVLSGGLFAAGSRLFAELTGATTATATGAVYLLEAAGSGLGGVLASLALVRVLTAFEIAAILGVLNLAAAWVLVGRVVGRRRLLAASFGALAVLVLAGSYELEPVSRALLWRGFHLIATRNSVFGSLAVVETGASRSLFENGLIVMTVPDPAAAEEAVHYALLEHPEPRSLLLVGGGVNGSVAEALTHPSLERVDYVELDPMIFNIAARYFPEAWEKIQRDPRVRIHAMDGRRFLKSTTDSFDVIIVNLPDPHTAQLNRFYTEEFFREAAAKLPPGGIVSFQVTSSENYISQERADFLRCLERTLRAVFPEVTAIPGETVHFFAAAKPGTLTADPKELVRRLRARRLHTEYVREYFLPFRMSPDRMQDLQLQIEPQPNTPVNRDFAPVAYYFDVALWSSRFHRTSARWIESLAGVRFERLLAATTLALAALLPLLWVWPGGAEEKPAARARRAAALAVATMGFTELGLEILLLLGFQALYGYVYQQLTILVALFMVGMAMGAWLELRSARGRSAPHARRELRVLAGLQFIAAASPLLLYGMLVELGRVSSAGGQRVASQILFPALALVAGLLGGFQFLLASRVYFAGTRQRAGSPGVLYGLDLAGACAGALALSVLLIPVYGFLRTAVLMAAANLAPALLAALAGWAGWAGQEGRRL
ncbi:MAG: fused MFS/spermidine synthase [Terriglobia bacterium]|jgi:spermidine synthase